MSLLFQFFQVDLGIAVQRACENVTQPLRFLYPLDISIKEKIEAIARSYGASGVECSEQVKYAIPVSCFHYANHFGKKKLLFLLTQKKMYFFFQIFSFLMLSLVL